MRLGRVLKILPFGKAVVTAACDFANQYRLIELCGEVLKNGPWVRGSKVHFEILGKLARTHVPILWDTQAGSARFLFFLHGKGPGSDWAAALKRGDLCELSIPKPDVCFCNVKGATVFFGDETSIGTAQALSSSAYASHEHQYVLEVSCTKFAEQVIRDLRLFNTTLIQKTAKHEHFEELQNFILGLSRIHRLPNLILTGRAQSIQRLRSGIAALGLYLPSPIVKPYWAEGKTGLQ